MLNKKMKNSMEKVKRKKGMASIEIAISFIIIVFVFCGLTDMIRNTQKLDTASSVGAYVARAIGNQGGVKPTQEPQHLGNYVTTGELVRNVGQMMNASGIKDNKWELYINGQKMDYTTAIGDYDFGERMNIEVKVTYDWALMSQVSPVPLEATKSSNRTVVSGFKKRGDAYTDTN